MSSVDFDSLSTIGDLVARAGEVFRGKIAFRMPDGRGRSFQEMAERSLRLGAALRSLGLQAGDRIAVLSRNRIECLEVLFASSSGLIPVPLNWRLSPRELAVVLSDCAPRAIFADETYTATIEAIRRDLPIDALLFHFDAPATGWRSYEELMRGGGDQSSLHQAAASDTACIIYTSGTTGRPKGVDLSHRGLLLNCRAAMEQMLHLTADDVGLTCMPLFHVGGMWYHAFPGFAAGSTMTLVPEFNPQVMLRLLAEHRASHIHLVPTMLHALLAQPNVAEFDLGALRLIYYGASAIPLDLLQRATRMFAHCDFVQGYGSTEAGVVTHLDPEAHRSDGGRRQLLQSCGRPVGGVALRLDPIGHDGEGRIGELLVKSPMSMRGYWNNAEATAQAFNEGWLRTGDIASIDGDGNVTILDRRNDMIVTGGENVFPREVEDVLLADPSIEEAAVFDLPDPAWVQRVVAAVVLKQGHTGDAGAMLARLKGQLAAYKCPKEIFFTGALPKNGAGKILRKALRAAYGAEQEGTA